MLVLTRKFGERIHIGDEITISIVAIRGNRVQLGIQAPADLPIARTEIAPRGLNLAEPARAPAVGLPR